MIPLPQPNMTPTHDLSSGGILVSTDGRELPLRGVRISADGCAGLLQVTLEQTFTNPHAEPLRVTYQVPLPADAAVSGFSFTVGEDEIVGRVDRKAAAREQFEQAILEGRTAALLEQDRSSLFTQEVGNIPPGATVVARIRLDQKLAWSEGGWQWRFPTVVAPRYLGASGRVADAKKTTTEVTTDKLPFGAALQLRIRDAVTGGSPQSPSHQLTARRCAQGYEVELAEGEVALDRDVVVRWPVAKAEPGVAIDVGRPPAGSAVGDDAFALLTVVPPFAAARRAQWSRDLIVLIDTSGSMHGEPLDHARRVVGALIDSLGERDQVELIEFSTSPRRWSASAQPATAKNKKAAHKWLGALRAGGGTEMRSGILAALGSLRSEAQRQVVVVTDGLIGFEHEIVDEIANRLPAGSRVHTVGVGSAVNRSLTMPAARAGRGAEVIIGLGEDPERATATLMLRTAAPLVVDVTIEGDALLEHVPFAIPDLYAGGPTRISARLLPGGGNLIVRGRSAFGAWEERVQLPAIEPGEGSPALAVLYAREAVEDLEVKSSAGDASPALDKKIERLGLDFQISTRLTTWVAIADEAAVDPQVPTRREKIPQQLPFGMSVAGLGLRSGAPQMQSLTAAAPKLARAITTTGILGEAAHAVKGFFTGGPAGGRSRAKREPGPPAAPQSRPMAPPPPEQAADDDGLGDMLEESAVFAPQMRSIPLRGRARTVGALLIIEVEVELDADWELPEDVEVQRRDGSTATVTVMKSQTTAAGQLSAGTVLRLVLKADASIMATNLSMLELVLDGIAVEVELTAA